MKSFPKETIICQFIFSPGQYDEEFYKLDAQIDEFANSLDGFLGVERWFSEDQTIKNVSYYFSTQDAVRQLASYPQHLEAKSKNALWYDGYKIVISEITSTYGDGRI